ncbi:MAG: dCMP deaminase family protein [Alphaproteobacteria bacterium]|nr:dCMP deaminase family protein [Alphaproteobacteria bacterium]
MSKHNQRHPRKTDWDEIFLLMAFAMASASHCVSRQVGALLVKDKRIISTGINGTPEGCPNCDEIFPPKSSPEFNRTAHHEFSMANEIHAEMNALLFKGKEGGGYNLTGATLYCTTQPCNECLKNLVQSGVSRIVYAESYSYSNYSDFILDAIKRKKIQLEYKPISQNSPAFAFIMKKLAENQK